MSNTPKASAPVRSLDDFRKKAENKNGSKPFVLPVDDERTIEIPRPTGGAIMDAEEAGNSREIIRILCGEKAEEFLEVVEAEDAAVMKEISLAMQKHFGMLD